MIFRTISAKKDLEKFLAFPKEVYKDSNLYRDSMSSMVKMFLYGKTVFLERGEFIPFLIEDQEKTLIRGAFILDHHREDSLLISFFEALKGQDKAVELMLQEAKTFARSKGIKKIIIGLEAHLNYAVGFLASHFHEAPCFGFNYTPEYYLDYFRDLKEVSFTSILVDIEKFNISKEEKVLERVKRKGFTFRIGDFSKLEKEIEIFTQLNNLCFNQHLWWTDRTVEEDKELFYPFKWFLKEENLIVAEKDGKPIGLILWYPDFNQIVPPRGTIKLETLLKLKLGYSKKISRAKIADMVIDPQYQGSGVIMGLFDMLYTLTKNRYKTLEGGWIASDNHLSKSFAKRWAHLGCREYKQYKAFELEIEDGC